jgi:hypothetical protein
MPKWAARIKSKVLRVWYERVQDISAEDIRKEGVSWDSDGFTINQIRFMGLWDSIYQHKGLCDTCGGHGIVGCPKTVRDCPDCRSDGHMNGPYSWEANPWVECIEFSKENSNE